MIAVERLNFPQGALHWTRQGFIFLYAAVADDAPLVMEINLRYENPKNQPAVFACIYSIARVHPLGYADYLDGRLTHIFTPTASLETISRYFLQAISELIGGTWGPVRDLMDLDIFSYRDPYPTNSGIADLGNFYFSFPLMKAPVSYAGLARVYQVNSRREPQTYYCYYAAIGLNYEGYSKQFERLFSHTFKPGLNDLELFDLRDHLINHFHGVIVNDLLLRTSQ